VSDQVQADVLEVPHAVEDRAQAGDRAGRNVCDTRREADRRDQIRELHGLGLVREHFALLELVAEVGPDPLGILRPQVKGIAAGKMALHGRSGGALGDLRRPGCRRAEERPSEQ
jgi:hypothetical protein